jgi:hypothetical protein
MERVEVNIETGETKVITLTEEEIAEMQAPYLAQLAALTWDDIRAKRDSLISSSDWTMIPGATVDQHAWAVYRQILRDIPQTFKDRHPSEVIWPELPSTSGPNQKAAEASAQLLAELDSKVETEVTIEEPETVIDPEV